MPQAVDADGAIAGKGGELHIHICSLKQGALFRGFCRLIIISERVLHPAETVVELRQQSTQQ